MLLDHLLKWRLQEVWWNGEKSAQQIMRELIISLSPSQGYFLLYMSSIVQLFDILVFDTLHIYIYNWQFVTLFDIVILKFLLKPPRSVTRLFLTWINLNKVDLFTYNLCDAWLGKWQVQVVSSGAEHLSDFVEESSPPLTGIRYKSWSALFLKLYLHLFRL